MSEVTCPYCGKDEYVEGECHPDHDDDPVEWECGHCEKGYMLKLDTTYDLTGTKAPCLNGAPHDMQPVHSFPKYWPEWVRCKNCDHEVKGAIDQDKINEPSRKVRS